MKYDLAHVTRGIIWLWMGAAIFLGSPGLADPCARNISRYKLDVAHLQVRMTLDSETRTLSHFYFSYSPPMNPLEPIRMRLGGRPYTLTVSDIEPGVDFFLSSAGRWPFPPQICVRIRLRENRYRLGFKEIVVTQRGGVLVRRGDWWETLRNVVPLPFGRGVAERMGSWDHFPTNVLLGESAANVALPALRPALPPNLWVGERFYPRPNLREGH